MSKKISKEFLDGMYDLRDSFQNDINGYKKLISEPKSSDDNTDSYTGYRIMLKSKESQLTYLNELIQKYLDTHE